MPGLGGAVINGVRIQEGRCLPISRWGVGCGACLAACPVGVLSFSDKIVRMGDGCLGCGRCAAACPTGALQVDGFARLAEDVSVIEGTVVLLECARVPREDSVPGATRVPCLGGLGSDVLMELVAAADGRAIRLVDRGWCESCPAGGKSFSPNAVVDSVRATLAAVGTAPEEFPVLEPRPLPPGRRDDAPVAGDSLSRRALLRRVSRDVPTRRGIEDHRYPPAARRLAEADLVRRLARRRGRAVPAIFPRAALAGSCADHRICAAACPTGALATDERGSTRGLVFKPDRCLACGRCAESCPTDSIRIAATGGGIAETTLAVRDLSCCPECEDEFFDRDGAGLCPACRKERAILSNPLTPRMSIQDLEESAP